MPFSSLESFTTKVDKSAKIEDSSTKISFAYRQFDESYLTQNTHHIKELDLTENNFTGATDLRFLVNFPNLQTLILDKNRIQSNFIIPQLDFLTTLCVNDNKIENLEVFMNHLQESCPNLTYLSMLKNKAAPSYFNGGSLNDYNDYRLFVISKLPKLRMLDDKEITLNERSQSKGLYGKTMNPSYQRRSSSKIKVKQKKSLEEIKKVNSDIDNVEEKIPIPPPPPPPPLSPLIPAALLPEMKEIQSQPRTPPPLLEALPQPPVPNDN